MGNGLMRIFFYLMGGLMCVTALWGASLDRHRGSVSLNGKTDLTKGQAIKAGDRLIARGPKSFFIVKYDNGSRFLVRDGELTIDKLKNKSSEVGLLRGTFLSFVDPKSKQSFKVKTRTASLGVRGTKFWVSESREETYLCVCKGDVEIANETGRLVVSENEDIRVKSKGQKLAKSTASDMMWNMAVDGFKELGFTIPRR